MLGIDRVGQLPERGNATAFAEAHDAVVGGADVSFHAGVVDFFERLANRPGQRERAHFALELADGRKIHFPKIEIGIDESDAVGVNAVVRANLADDADLGFLVAIGPAQDEFLLRRELVLGEDAGAVEAEDDGVGALGKDGASQIVADEEDGKFLRDASSAAHNLWWQE